MADWKTLADSEKQRIIASGTDEEKRRHHATVCKMSGSELKPLDINMLRLYDCKPPSSGMSGAALGIMITIIVLLFVVCSGFAYYVLVYKAKAKNRTVLAATAP